MAVVIETTIGDFTVDLYTDERPQTCRNFLKLCKMKYYNWSLFYTVQNKFIAQAGDPTATGSGGESIYGILYGNQARFYEAEKMPKIKHDRIGLLSMVDCGDNMLGSQFIITLGDELQSLDGHHCVFGEITEGLEIVRKFNETICDEDHRPYQDIRISHTVILEDPYDDPKELIIPDKSPERTREALESTRIGADEIIDDTAGMCQEEIRELQEAKEAKARATILEIVGDIPDADIAPPENVLFVCKLNPVTNDDDLEIIFSRFGKIESCEVIRDQQTGDSLQYAFIEFADKKSCEDAYFKMDNVLIDDRRIHVDFSQSVSKIKWFKKGKYIIKGEVNGNDGTENNRSRGRKDPHPDKAKHRDRRRSRSRTPNDRRKRSRSPDFKRRRSRDRQLERKHKKEKRRSRSREEKVRRSRSRSREEKIRRSRSKSREDKRRHRHSDKNRHSKDHHRERNRRRDNRR